MPVVMINMNILVPNNDNGGTTLFIENTLGERVFDSALHEGMNIMEIQGTLSNGVYMIVILNHDNNCLLTNKLILHR
jgi:hypothetical protein